MNTCWVSPRALCKEIQKKFMRKKRKDKGKAFVTM